MTMSRTRITAVILIFIMLTIILSFGQRLLARTATPTDEMACVDGMAGEYPCKEVDFLSYLSLEDLGSGAKAANLWGWTDSVTGKEYVLQAMTDALVFVDISDPVNPVVVGRLPNESAVTPNKYRDVKVYNDHAFIIADENSEHGMQIFDLTQLRTVTETAVFSATATYNGVADGMPIGNLHNIFINEATGYAYAVRATTPVQCNGAMMIYNINDPLNPKFAGCNGETSGAASDSMCVIYNGPDVAYQGQEICILASDDNIAVSDVTSKTNPVELASLTYPDIRRAHLAWLTEDHRYFVSADMNDEKDLGLNTRIMIWDFTTVTSPTLMGIYEGPTPASDHNVWVKGGYAYIGNFRAGVRILDLKNIAQTTMTNTAVTEAAFFDIYPADNNTGHLGGAWAVYPFFESGVIAVSDKEAGLYLLRPTLETTYLPLISSMP